MNVSDKISFKKIKEFIIKRKYLLLLILVAIIISILVIKVLIDKTPTSNTTYNDIKTLMDNKETFIIYYYNSKSSNKYNKDIKQLLDKNKINYYMYDDNKVNKEEYSNFLSLIGIDEKLFGTPAIIYIKDGKMYSNLISIDNENSVNAYIKDYDLVTIK